MNNTRIIDGELLHLNKLRYRVYPGGSRLLHYFSSIQFQSVPISGVRCVVQRPVNHRGKPGGELEGASVSTDTWWREDRRLELHYGAAGVTVLAAVLS